MCLYTNVQRQNIQNSQKAEPTPMSGEVPGYTEWEVSKQ